MTRLTALICAAPSFEMPICARPFSPGDLTDAVLTRAKLLFADFRDVIVVGAKLDEADFRDARIGGVSFAGTDLRAANLNGR